MARRGNSPSDSRPACTQVRLLRGFATRCGQTAHDKFSDPWPHSVANPRNSPPEEGTDRLRQFCVSVSPAQRVVKECEVRDAPFFSGIYCPNTTRFDLSLDGTNTKKDYLAYGVYAILFT
jgi:hypothetical protein